jgi:GH15 family glucan-1,4-alpha-glucosidase
LARLGQVEEGRRVLVRAMGAANHVGLLPEHFDPRTGQAHGNAPQCYSHVGLIAAAFAVNPDSPLLG